MASFLPPAVFEIKAIANEAIAKFDDVNKELDKMGKNADTAGGKMSGIDKASKIATAGLLAMGAAFAGFAAIGIKEAMQAEQVMNELGITMANAGVNTAANRAQVEALTKGYIDLGFADEDAAGAFNVLLRATGDVTKSQDLMSLSADYARVKHISMADAASVMAKAGQGSVKAFKEMGISLDTTLPKSEAIAKAMDQLKEKIGGQAVGYTKTFAGQMAVMKAQFDETAQTLGTALLPILTSLMDDIRGGIKFIQQHAAAFKLLAGIVLTLTVALASYNLVAKATVAWDKAMAIGKGIQATVTAMLTGEQVALNTAMELNPVGLIVAGVMLLVGAFILLWNKSEPFRKLIIAIGKAGISAFAFIVEAVGWLAEAFIKVETGPLKLLLKGLALLGVGPAKTALKELEKGTDAVGKFFDDAAKKVKGMGDKLDGLNKPIKIPINFSGGGIPEVANGTGSGGGGGNGLSAAEKAKAKAAAAKDNEGYLKDLKSFMDKVATAKTKFSEAMTSAQNKYDEKTASLRKDANEKINKLNTDAAEKDAKLLKDYNAKKADIQKRYDDETKKLNLKKTDDLESALKDHNAKMADITQSGAEKLASIVTQSVDRLRNAFIKGTEINVSDIFKGLAESGAQSAQGLLDALKTKLTAAKDLAANAAKLQALGFSQTFIEQVVAAGPEAGNQLAKSLQDATPATIKELQATYADMEKTTNTGLDKLAVAMNSGGKLATDELNQAYAQAQKDMANFLTAEQKAYTEKQAEINKTFNTAMADAEATRTDALAAAKADYDDALAQSAKDLADSIAAVNKDLNDALDQASKDLADAQAAARKDLADSLAAINADYQDKMGKIQNANAATIASINALKAAMAAAASLTVTPYNPLSGMTASSGGGSSTTYNPLTGMVVNNNTTVNASTNASAASIAAAASSAAKLASTVTVNTTTLAGIMAASKQTTPTVAQTTGVSNKIKAMGLNIL